MSLTAAALGLPPDGLLNTHRLDVGTSGLVVLARSPAFASWFSALLKNKPDTFVKTYRCLRLGTVLFSCGVTSRGPAGWVWPNMEQCYFLVGFHHGATPSRLGPLGSKQRTLLLPRLQKPIVAAEACPVCRLRHHTGALKVRLGCAVGT